MSIKGVCDGCGATTTLLYGLMLPSAWTHFWRDDELLTYCPRCANRGFKPVAVEDE